MCCYGTWSQLLNRKYRKVDVIFKFVNYVKRKKIFYFLILFKFLKGFRKIRLKRRPSFLIKFLVFANFVK